MPTNYDFLPLHIQHELSSYAKHLVRPGMGLLSIDEKPETFGKRLNLINLENTVENRCAYREMLFTTEPKMREHISGAILSDESLYQESSGDRAFTRLLADRRIDYGVTVDLDLAPLTGTEDEFTTLGIDQVPERILKFKAMGSKFLQWRAVFKVDEDLPSMFAIQYNAKLLAQCALNCQLQGLVPIVESEILSYGAYSLKIGQRIAAITLSNVIKALQDQHVLLEGILLKTNFVVPGLSWPNTCTAKEIAHATVTTISRCVPAAVPGIVFVTGEISEEDATCYLNEMAKIEMVKPWALTFAFSRGLQISAMRCWNGKQANVQKAQIEFLKRARANGLAVKGEYVPGSTPTWMPAIEF